MSDSVIMKALTSVQVSRAKREGNEYIPLCMFVVYNYKYL